jgi:hypothetical protein
MGIAINTDVFPALPAPEHAALTPRGKGEGGREGGREEGRVSGRDYKLLSPPLL